MDNEESKQTPQKENSPTPESLAAEMETIRATLQKRKSETTTLRILFYTGLAVLLFGFIYTNQTLQRAQYRNLESNINLLQNRVDHTLLLLENKLHEEIQGLDEKLNGGSNLHESIESMNQALTALDPETTAAAILIEKVERNSNELSQMVRTLESRKETPPVHEIFAVE